MSAADYNRCLSCHALGLVCIVCIVCIVCMRMRCSTVAAIKNISVEQHYSLHDTTGILAIRRHFVPSIRHLPACHSRPRNFSKPGTHLRLRLDSRAVSAALASPPNTSYYKRPIILQQRRGQHRRIAAKRAGYRAIPTAPQAAEHDTQSGALVHANNLEQHNNVRIGWKSPRGGGASAPSFIRGYGIWQRTACQTRLLGSNTSRTAIESGCQRYGWVLLRCTAGVSTLRQMAHTCAERLSVMAAEGAVAS